MKDHVGAFEQAHRAKGQQIGGTGPGAHQPDLAARRRLRGGVWADIKPSALPIAAGPSQATVPAATVRFDTSSMTMKEPVTRCRA
jgi:hypothetical protein